MRRDGHVAVEAVEAVDVAVLLHPLAEEGPAVGEELAVGVDGEDALFLTGRMVEGRLVDCAERMRV